MDKLIPFLPVLSGKSTVGKEWDLVAYRHPIIHLTAVQHELFRKISRMRSNIDGRFAVPNMYKHVEIRRIDAPDRRQTDQVKNQPRLTVNEIIEQVAGELRPFIDYVYRKQSNYPPLASE